MEDMIDRNDKSVIHETGFELCGSVETEDVMAYKEGLREGIAKRTGKRYVLLAPSADGGSYESYAADRPII